MLSWNLAAVLARSSSRPSSSAAHSVTKRRPYRWVPLTASVALTASWWERKSTKAKPLHDSEALREDDQEFSNVQARVVVVVKRLVSLRYWDTWSFFWSCKSLSSDYSSEHNDTLKKSESVEGLRIAVDIICPLLYKVCNRGPFSELFCSKE